MVQENAVFKGFQQHTAFYYGLTKIISETDVKINTKRVTSKYHNYYDISACTPGVKPGIMEFLQITLFSLKPFEKHK